MILLGSFAFGGFVPSAALQVFCF